MGKLKPKLNNDGRLEAALELARQGFPVFPCHYIVGGRCSCRKPKCTSGKHPATRTGFKEAVTDASKIEQMWGKSPYNIGLATGHVWPAATGEHKYLAVPDIDIADGKLGQQSLKKLIERYSPLPKTLRVKTGSGGTHFYFLTRRPVKSFKADDGSKHCPLGINIDLRGAGGYVLAAGSNHSSGGTYTCENPGIPIAPMPEWMEELLEYEDGTRLVPIGGDIIDAEQNRIIERSLLPIVPTDEELRCALDAIPAELVNEYNSGSEKPGCWWEVGAALRTLGEGYFAFWKEWSRRAPKFKTDYSKKMAQWESDLEKFWCDFKPQNFYPETIFWYARKNKKYRMPERIVQAQKEEALRDAILINQPDKVLAETIREHLEKKQRDAQPILFRFGSEVARPRRVLRRGFDGEYEYQIEPLRKDTALLQALNYELNFVKFARDGSVVSANLLKATAEHILQCQPGQFPLPPVAGITSTPVMLSDGSIYNTPGYCETTRLYHYPEVTLPAIEERPTKRDIDRAGELLQEVYCDIPFTHASDKAHALALLILPVLRSLIDGDTPGHFITKPVQGTGATLLANAAIFLKTGRDKVYPQNAPSENAEWQKTILADLLTGVDFCFYDDCRSLRSPILATVLTSNGSYKGRKLGGNVMLLVPNRAVWMFVGNNPQISKDLRRRLIDIRIDAEMADPTERAEFKHPDILPWLKEPGVRAAVIAAIFTLARAWIQKGRPKSKSMASFQNWAHVIGGILDVAGVAGFLESPKDRLVDEQEAETSEFIHCLAAHRIKYPPGCGGGNPSFVRMKASQMLEMADNCGLEIAAGLEGQGQERARNFVKDKLNVLRDRVFNIVAMVNATVEQIEGKAEIPTVSVKLTYNPTGGDSYWKLLFQDKDEKGNRVWSGDIPSHFKGVGIGDIWAGGTWEYRKQGMPVAGRTSG